MMALNILVVDDEEPARRLLHKALAKEFRAEEAPQAEVALELLRRRPFDVVLLDQRMPGMSGLEALKEIKRLYPDTHVIMVTAMDDLSFVIECMQAGAEDYLVKPIVVDALRSKLRAFGERRSLSAENRRLQAELAQRSRFERMIGDSPAFRAMLSKAEEVSEPNIPVLVHGESGSGKELVARFIHRQSPRRDKAFLVTNCAALHEEILASELFGHVRGAFSGAHEDKKGLFAAADGGTLFLDEIGEISGSFQAQLLRVLEYGEILPVGSSQPTSVDTRVIAATNRDLEEEVRDGRFRKDLFYRLWKVPVRVPPLRERPEDVQPLAEHFLKRYRTELNKATEGFSEEAHRLLTGYSWPGNVRELQNVVERAVIQSRERLLGPDSLSLDSRRLDGRTSEDVFSGPWKEAKVRFERTYVEQALQRADGNVSLAARQAGLDRRNFRNKMIAYGIAANAMKRRQ